MSNSQFEEIKRAANRQIAEYHRIATDYGPDNSDSHQTYAMGQEDGAHAILFIINQVMKKAAGVQTNGKKGSKQ